MPRAFFSTKSSATLPIESFVAQGSRKSGAFAPGSGPDTTTAVGGPFCAWADTGMATAARSAAAPISRKWILISFLPVRG